MPSGRNPRPGMPAVHLEPLWRVWHQMLDNPRKANPDDGMKGALLGPNYSDAEVQDALSRVAGAAQILSDGDLADRVAVLLGEGKVIGWFNGRMEFGPRALGSRSIIGDARSQRMQSMMNLKIKFRESFRPFAPCVLYDHVHEYFDLNCESPYMMLVAEVAEDKRLPLPTRSSIIVGNRQAQRSSQLHPCRDSRGLLRQDSNGGSGPAWLVLPNDETIL